MVPSSAPEPPVGAVRPLRYGIVGAGMMGQEHLRNLLALEAADAGVEVVALADPFARSLSDSQGWLPPGHGVATFPDHRALLTDAGCDVVVVATPNHTHAAVLDDLLAADVHLLVEKPLCTTVADCRRVVEAARDRSGLVWVGLEYRYMPPVAALIDAVDGGAVGRVRMVAIREHRFPFLPKVDDWNRFSRNTGGTLVEKCCHFFDLMHRVVGERPTSVYASGGQAVNHLDEVYDGEVPDLLDHAFVILDFASGARGLLDLCMFAEGSVNQEEVSVVGDVGKVEAFLPSSILRVGARTGGAASVREEAVTDPRVAHEGFHHGASYVEHLELLAAIRTGTAPEVGVDEGLWSVAVGVAAHRSIDEHRPVELAEVLGD